MNPTADAPRADEPSRAEPPAEAPIQPPAELPEAPVAGTPVNPGATPGETSGEAPTDVTMPAPTPTSANTSVDGTPSPDALPPEALSPEATAGMGEPLETPIATLPPIQPTVGTYPLSRKTGEPVRPRSVVVGTALFFLASGLSFAAYWYYWWTAIHMVTFLESAHLLALTHPRPGSLASVILVCVMAVLGVIMTGGPGVAGYNLWHGASFSRIAAIVACVTGLLAFFFFPLAWIPFGISAVATVFTWLPTTTRFIEAWQEFDEPTPDPIDPPVHVEYGPAPRFR